MTAGLGKPCRLCGTIGFWDHRTLEILWLPKSKPSVLNLTQAGECSVKYQEGQEKWGG